MPADLTLNTTFPPSSGKGSVMLICVIPGYQSGQRPASLKSAMVSCGEALIWTLRCTIAIAGLPLSVSCLATARRRRPIGSGRAARTLDERGAIEAPPCVVTVRIGNGPYVNGRSLIR